MTYYLDRRVDVLPTSCNEDGSQVMDVRVRLHNTAPAGGKGLTAYILGNGTYGYPPGAMRLTVLTYSPAGGQVVGATVNGRKTALSNVTQDGRAVGAITVDIDAGHTTVLNYTVRSGAGQTGNPDLQTTPGIRTTGVGTVGDSRC
jgi:hypothetical protein